MSYRPLTAPTFRFLAIIAAGAWLTVSPMANTLGFVPLLTLYWRNDDIMTNTDDRQHRSILQSDAH